MGLRSNFFKNFEKQLLAASHWFTNLLSIVSITHKISRHKLREHLINGCDTMGLRKYTARVLFSVAIHTTKEKNDFRHLNEHADHEPYNN